MVTEGEEVEGQGVLGGRRGGKRLYLIKLFTTKSKMRIFD
jgi:hypothetical protein